MNRRGFFARVLGGLSAAVIAPFLPTAKLTPIPGTWGAIGRSTFPFWQSRGPSTINAAALENLRSAMRQVHNDCSRHG